MSSSTRARAWRPGAGLALRGLPLVAAWLSASFALTTLPIDGLLPWQVRLLAIIAIGSLVLGSVLGMSSQQSGTPAARLDRALRLLSPAALPLAGLLLLPREFRFAAVVMSALLAAWYTPRGLCKQLVDSRAWRVAFMAFAACGAVIFIAIGRALPGSFENDAAYYFGMARHLVLTHRWDEPLVWQFLTRTAQLTHAPFDYWHGFTALSLVPAMAMFGPTHLVAGTVMGVVSATCLMLFAHLISSAAPLENPLLQVLAFLLFMWSPAVQVYRFDVDTVAFVHLWLLASLIALAKRRLAWAAAFACFSFLWRAETIMLTVLLSGAAIYLAVTETQCKRQLRRVLLVLGSLAFGYIAYHWCVFGTPGPPGALVASCLSNDTALYAWKSKADTLALGARFAPEYVAARVQVATDTLGRASFFPYHSLWLGCALLAGKRMGSRRRGLDAIARCLLFVGAAAVTLANPAVFAFWRSLHTLLPVFVLAGAYGAESLLNSLSGLIEQTAHSARLSRMFVAGCGACAAVAMVQPLSFSEVHPPAHAFTKELAALDATLAGQPVMSARSWFVLAYTGAPAVSLPSDGEAGIAAALRHYAVKWLLIVNGEDPPGSSQVFNELRAGTRSQLDGVHLTLHQQSSSLTLFRVE